MSRHTTSIRASLGTSLRSALCIFIFVFLATTPSLAIPFTTSARNDAADESLLEHVTTERMTVTTPHSLPATRMIPTIKLRSLAQHIIRTTNASDVPLEPHGLSFDPCKDGNDCKAPHHCAAANFDGLCDGRIGCFCLADETQVCKPCEKCIGSPNLTCAIEPFVGNQETGICVSSFVVQIGVLQELGCNGSVPDSSPLPDFEDDDESSEGPKNVPTVFGLDDDDKPKATDEPRGTDQKRTPSHTEGCIDARLMQHIPPSRRVYARHRHARALCDAHDSCATPGHMVVHRGNPMMMREYCQDVAGGCVERALLVNSPRFARQLRVASRTSELEFTAFAARFESRVERHALVLAIRVGL